MKAAKSLQRCYYETLEVDKDATEEDLKKAYRTQALKWHPDKNFDNLEEATARFKEIQAAFEVLSDPQERAWYDRHRDEILRGRSDIVDDQAIDLMPFFVSSCYSGFGDDDDGFYSIYRTVFETIAKEDMPYYPKDRPEPPSFGKRDEPYENVHNFYAHWQAYSTSRTFAHLDKYSTLDAENRREFRWFEKENSRIREAARKERNQEVRQLVDYVRKRDKRVQLRKKELQAKAEENRKKTQENRIKQIQKRRQELESYQEEESSWMSMASLEHGLKQLEKRCDQQSNEKRKSKKNKDKKLDNVDEVTGTVRSSNSIVCPNSSNSSNSNVQMNVTADTEDAVLYCLACEKSFKTVNAFDNHERSKKHKVNLAQFNKLMEEGANEDNEESDLDKE